MEMLKRLFCITGLLFSIGSYSANASEIDSLVYLKGVVISANKVQVSRNSVPLTISVIERAEIEASSESALLPVLSQHVPGLFVTQKGITGFGVSSGSAGTVNIRGVGQGNKVLMLQDGQPQWAGIFGHSLPDTYVASDVEKVEVIRGPGSLLYGSNAMGGVINVITRHHNRKGRRTQARVMYGSYNTQKYMVNNGYNSGGFSSFISLNHDRTDGHRPHSKFHITNGFANLGYKINNRYKMTGNVSLAKFKTQNPGMITEPLIDNIINVLRGSTSFTLENNHENKSGALRLFYNWGNHTINDGYSPGENPKQYIFKSNDHNTGILLYQSFQLFEGNNFTAGIDYKNWGGDAWNDSINGNSGNLVDKSVNELAGYMIVQQDISDRFTLNAGVRYEYNSIFGAEWVPQVGITVRPFEDNVIKASLSKGFRSPNIREMYMFPPQNVDLKPEKMMNYEVSLGQAFLNGNLFAEITAFYIKGKNMIQTESVGGNNKPPYKNMNTGNFTNKGAEIDFRYKISQSLNVSMNYSYLHTNKPLLAAPVHKSGVNATYMLGCMTFNLNIQSVYDLYIRVNEKKSSENLKESYTILNAKASYRFGVRDKGMNLFLKGENLTATHYSINNGFPMPKAIFTGGIDIVF